MRSITLGRTGLDVSRIAFGTWQLGGEWGASTRPRPSTPIRRARDLGITLFDTAQAYGFGASEQLLGRRCGPSSTSDRDERGHRDQGRHPHARARRLAGLPCLRPGVEESLRHLGVDVIDIYQVHWPDPDVPAEETAGALQELVDEGKIRFAGVSNYDVPDLEAFEAVRPVDVLQPPYHLFRRAIEAEILPYARAHDIGVLAYSPLASGLLAGRDRRGHHLRARRLARPGERVHRRGPAAQPGGGAAARGPGGRPRHPAWASSRSRGCSPSPGCTSPSWARAAAGTSTRAPRRPTSSSRRRPSRASTRSPPARSRSRAPRPRACAERNRPAGSRLAGRPGGSSPPTRGGGE